MDPYSGCFEFQMQQLQQELLKNAKKLTLEFKAGVVDGTYFDKEGQAIAKSIKDVLISKLLGSLQSPVANFVRVVNKLQKRTKK